ncbi:gcc-2 [Pristionchus pacificus]|uniref:GRIP domain-containing protein n=1 Tax=Pristionchus pacificus TaxID=54126 RepID=A0A2A6BEX8_PRIPA|nr:gcc-2 [Pristionchus pacificus]|eukprot:PDM64439.1 hypothetical protein PRIPAC_52695 [Pristionchus pacificus]
MSESETSAPPAPKPAAKPGGLREKIKTSSKEELEVLANKLIDSLRISKDKADKLQSEKVEFEKLIAQKDVDIESLKKREADLLLALASTSFTVESPNLQESDSADGNSELVEEHRRRLEEVERAREKAEKERRRREEDLEAAKALNDELRSQLEDARAEASTLREAKTSMDVACLELADYAKKVKELTKELKETKAALELSDREKDGLAEELARLRDESGKVAADSERAKSNADELRKRAQEETTRLAEMQLKVDEERKKAEGFHEDLTKERLALGRQLASSQERANKLEEIVEALREENGRLRLDRETADGRIEEVRKEYEAFKNRARYVLEQRTKENEEEEEREKEGKIEEERRRKEKEEMRKEVEIMRESHRRLECDMERSREHLLRESGERTKARREADEATDALAKALDELRSLRVSAERAEEESVAAKREGEERERRAGEAERRMKTVVKELDELREKSDEDRSRLETQLTEERRRREEAVRQLEDKREKAATRPAAVAAVYPQFSESFHSERSHSPMGDSASVVHGHAHGGPKSSMGGYAGGGHNNYSFDDTQRCEMSPERLESVLFGEEACDEGRPIDEVVPLEDPVEEVIRLRQQLKWMQEMHTEAETAAANMGEQMRVLKEEIRRLQRNSERTFHVEGNTEYLKNVIIKFISPEKVSGEKRALIPILHTMLRLSDEERNLLQNVADTAPLTDDASATAGWGGMLTKWTGLS